MNDNKPTLEQLKRAALLKHLRQTQGVRQQASTAIPVADRNGSLPLSWAQQRLWFLDRMDREASVAYHMPAALRLSGTLDRAALRATLDRIVARHEILRTRFAADQDGEPFQAIAGPEQGMTLVEQDLPGLDETARHAEVARISAAEAAAPFDLAAGPLIRGRLLRLAEDEHVLLITQHHIVSDGWSIGVLIKEVSALYAAFCSGGADPLPPLAIQYADFAAWQRAWLQGDALRAQLDFWRDTLAGAPALLELPVDRPRPVQQSHVGGSATFALSPAVSAGLRALSQRHGTTLFATVLAGWSVLLARLSGQADIVVGTPIANRQRAETEALIGFFVNTLALRVRLDDDPTVAELLAQVKAGTLAAYGHQDLPFEQVVEAVNPARSLAHNPIFQVMLTVNNAAKSEGLALPGLTLAPVDIDRKTTHFDLSLTLTDGGDAMFGTLGYASALFDHATAERWTAYLETLFAAMAADDRQPVSRLPLMAPAEQRLVVEEFNATRADFPRDGLIHAEFERQAATRPDAAALVCEDRRLSFRELNEQANRIAHRLLALGVKPEDRVAICMERSPDMVVGLLGILKAGAAYVPVDPGYPQERIAYMVADSAPAALLTVAPHRDRFDATLPCVALDEPVEAPSHNPDVALNARNLAYVIYTSGSTGTPKGVMVEHRNVLRLALGQRFIAIGEDDCVVHCANPAFDAATWEIWAGLLNGARLLVISPALLLDPAQFAAAMREERVTVLHLTIGLFNQYADALRDFFPTLSYLLFGGERADIGVVRRVLRHGAPRHLVHCYGPTETTTFATTFAAETLADDAPTLPIGGPIANTQVYILDNHLQPVPVGVAGELYIGGAGVARGYLNLAEQTAERFVADPFSTEPDARLYRTGDLGRWLPDGTIEYLGRNDFQVKIRGYRIEPGEIEATLAECPGVREAVVDVREDAPGEKRLVAYYLSASGPDIPLRRPVDESFVDEDLTESASAALARRMREHLARSLPEYMTPSAFVRLEQWPLTANGKLDRRALPAPDGAAVPLNVYEEPRGDNERALAEIWRDMLGLERVGRNDHFFALGGHSLQVVRMISRLQAQGLDADLRTIFTHPTLSAMAAALIRGGKRSDASAPPNLIAADCQSITPDMLPLIQLAQNEIDAIVAAVPGGVTNIQDIYALAPLQEGILFHHLLGGAGDSYLLRSVLAFDDRGRLDAFLGALQQVIDRHDILRTAVFWEGLAQPAQVVLRRAPLHIEETAFGDAAPAMEQLLARTDPAHRRLDLRQAPLLAATVAADPGTGEWLLALNYHHIVSDHVTLELIIGEIQLILQGDMRRLPPALPFRNFVAQARALSLEQHESYFREQFGAIDEPTAPFGVLDVQGDGTQIAEARMELDAALASALRACTRELGVTPAALFHTAWAQVLAQCCGRDEVVFGTVLSGRLHGSAGAASVMGMFINTLPLRVSLAGDVRHALRATYEQLTGLLQHEQAPLSLAQRASGVAAPLPLFTTLLNYRHNQAGSAQDGAPVAAWSGMRLIGSEERTNYPITMAVDDHGAAFSLTAQCTSGIDPARMTAYFSAAVAGLVDACTRHPHRPVRALAVLSGAERRLVLETFNDTRADFPRDGLIHAEFERQAAARPDEVALVCEDRRLSFRELNELANRIAHRLLALGVRPEDRVAICMERSLEMVVGMLAVLKAGAAYVPVDPGYPQERIAYMINDSAPAALLTMAPYRDRFDATLPCVALDEPVEAPSHNPDVALNARNLAYVIYTSGSTGTPKGVMVEHRNVLRLALGQRFIAIGEDDCVVHCANPAFDAATWEIWAGLLNGARLLVISPALLLDPAQFAAAMREERVTVLHLTIGLFNQYADALRDFFPTLSYLLFGGERADIGVVRRVLRHGAPRHLVHCYGPTETTTFATTFAAETLADDAPTLPIGGPIANTQVYILDNHLQPVPVGVAGELYIGGAGVARGYLNLAEQTAERFVADPFSPEQDARLYRTGDLGRWLPDGTIDYLGRNDFQVKIRGYRIELGEIEAKLAAIAGVREAVVVAREDAPGDKRLVAYLVADGDGPDATALREALTATLPEHMVPGAFVTLPAFPLTPNGKLDRRALPAPDQAAKAAQAYEAPVGDMESAIAVLWQELLAVERVGRHDNFFALGGHSLLVVTMIARLQKLGLEAGVRTIFAHPTPASLAATLAHPVRRGVTAVPPNLIAADTTRITPDMLPLVSLVQSDIDTIVAGVAGGVGNIQDIYALAPLQEGILFHHMLADQGDAYLLRSVIAFDSHARLDGFLGALQHVVARHDILRTAVFWKDLTQPAQVVLRQAPLGVDTLELRDDADAMEQLLALTEPSRYRMDLQRAPLLAATVAADRASGEWLLALNYHHMVSDHVTLELIIGEIRVLLQDGARKLPPALPFRNFVAQARAVSVEEHEAYFRAQLGDVEEPTAPFGIVDVQGNGAGVAEAMLALDAPLAQAVRLCAQRQGITPAALFHAAWAQVLALCCDRDDVVFGTVLSGRLQGTDGAGQVLGIFMNTLPLRVSLAQGARAAVRDTYRRLTDLLEHEQAPLSLAQRASGVAAPLPLFTALLNYRHSHAPDGESKPALAWQGMRPVVAQERTNYPVSMAIDDLGAGFTLTAQCAAGIDAARMNAYLVTAVAGLVRALDEQPDSPMVALPVLPDAERTDVLDGFNDTAVPCPPDLLVHQLFERQAARRPDATALTFEQQSLTYAELNRRANRLAHHLLGLRLQPDDRIAVCLERGPDMVVALLGVLKAGAAYVPLDPSYPSDRLAYTLADSAPVAVLTQRALGGVLAEAYAGGHTVLLDAPLPDNLPEHDPDLRGAGLRPHHLAYVIYTSGSTGKPKGVMVAHHGVVNFLAAMGALTGIGESDALLAVTTIAFDIAALEIYLPLANGARTVVASRATASDPALLAQAIDGVTMMQATPATWRALIGNGWTGAPHCTALCGGEALSAELRNALTGRVRTLWNLYGPTETTIWSASRKVGAGDAGAPEPIGQPIANTRIYILDRHLQPVPPGAPGEIHIGGAGVARGYLNRPELTAERFLADPFSRDAGARMYKTGDLGRWLPGGTIEYLGRNDFQVKVRGYRIELGEIETRLASCAGVREAVVLAREDVPGDKRLVAYLLAHDDDQPDTAALRAALLAVLPDYMVPAAFVTLPEFPLTPNGKLDRAALPAPGQDALVRQAYEAPEGPAETAIAAVWQDLLGVAQVGRHDNFFELGGHSLTAMQLVARLRQALGIEASLRDLFLAPTLAALAQRAGEAGAASLPAIEPARRDTELPLSWSQQRLWFLDRLDPAAGAAYHMPAALRLHGVLDRAALRATLDRIVARHEILRTRFGVNEAGEPIQLIAPADCGFPLGERDMRGRSAEAVSAAAAAEAGAPFDLAAGPLIRGRLLRVDDDEHVLLITQHHIVSDGWSTGVLVGEVCTLYAAYCAGQADPLPPLAIQYADYAVWQRRRLGGAGLDAQLDFWRAALDGAPALLELPTDRPRPAVQSHAGAVVPVALSPELTASLRQLGRRHGATLFMTLLAGWSALLARLSGQDDVVIGTSVANRQRAELEPLIGFFVNTLALRVRVDDEPSVAALLARVKAGTVEAYAHQDLPFEQVVEAVKPVRSMGHSPVFQVMFTLNNTPRDGNLTLPGLTLSPVELPHTTTQFDLSLSLTEGDGDLYGAIEYASALFDRATVERWAACFETLLAAMAGADERPVGELPLLPGAERERVLAAFNATAVAYPADVFAHKLFERQAALAPERTAVLADGVATSYGELNRRANRLAHHLLSLGVRPDDRVAICMERCADMVVALLGVLKAGAAYVPLDPAYPAERLSFMLEDSAPVLLLTRATTQASLPHGVARLALDADAARLSVHADHDPDLATVSGRHLAYVIYTSGSTGKPKGVMIEHAGLNNYLHWAADCYGAARQPLNAVVSSPIAFDATVTSLYLPLLSGGAVTIIRDGEEIAGLESLLGGGTACGLVKITPSHLRSLGERLADAGATCDVGVFVVGGEALPGSTVALWRTLSPRARVINEYGPTETVVGCVVHEADGTGGGEHGVPIGRPIANTQIYILDGHLQPVPVGAPGEIHIAGAGVARGYLNRPELSAERFLPDPFSGEAGARMYKTGDLGRWLADGKIEYLGRNDFQVKVRGYRIELGEIESRLAACEGVREAVVLAREIGAGDKRLVAYLLVHEGQAIDTAAVRAALLATLPEYMVPGAFVTLPAFPLTPNGKLDRAALPAPDQDALVRRDYEAPQDAVESAIAAVWQDLLGVARIGRHDNFFELGGHSLLLVSVIARLQKMGIEAGMRQLFGHPTPAGMASALALEAGVRTVAAPPNLIPPDCQAITPDMLPLITLTQADIETIVHTVPGGAANIQDIYALAPLQEGLLFHHLLSDQGDAYVQRSVVVFDSRARLDSFLGALQQVIARHDILRTAVFWEGLSQAAQVVLRDAPLHVDTPALDARAPAMEQLLALTEPARFRLDLRRAPLMTATLAADGDTGEWLMALNFHHMVSDHVTLELIMGEIGALLHGEQALPPAMPFRNFIAQARSISPDEHEAYFRQELAGIDEPTAPFGVFDAVGDVGEAKLSVDTALAQAVRECARGLGISPAALFHVAWGQVLGLCCGRDDVVFGTVLSGRLQGTEGADRVLGMFINTLPLRVSLADGAGQVVRETHRRLTGLLQHEGAPLSLAQRASAVAAPQPLFTSLLNYRHSRAPAGHGNAADAWQGVRLHSSKELTTYPVTMSVDDLGDGFTFTAQCTQGVDATRMNVCLQTALAGLVQALHVHPDTPMRALPVLPDAERRRLLEDFNPAGSATGRERLVHRLVEAHAQRQPDATAVFGPGMRLSYRELNRRANQVAHRLLELGVRRDDRVAVCMDRSADLVVGLLGVLKAGAAYVPFDPTYPRERLAFMLEDSAPAAVLTQARHRALLDSGVPRVLLDADDAALADSPVHDPDPAALGLHADHLAYVIYTSGSTGAPKGVANTIAGLGNRLCWFVDDVLAGPCTTAVKTSIGFVDSLTEILETLVAGGRLSIFAQSPVLDLPGFAQRLAADEVSNLVIVPSLLRQLLSLDADLPTLRTLVCSGEPLAPELIVAVAARHPHVRFFNFYGSSEANGDSTALEYTGAYDPHGIGRPIANTRLYVLDQHLRPVPVGAAGELYIGGEGLARGYLNRPDLTAERFLADPFVNKDGARMYKTGDLACWLEDGSIRFLGRGDFQVKVRGFRIELGEIEARLAACDGVREAVVVARDDGAGDKRLVAYLLAQAGAQLDPRALREALQAVLPEFMLPGAFVVLAEFPRTPSGKLDRRALPEPDEAALVRQSFEAPAGDMEQALAAIWRELLGVENVGRHDHFFALGGHSLLALQLGARVRRTLGLELSMQQLFAAPTLAELARALAGGALARQPGLLALRPEGTEPPLFVLHSGTGSAAYGSDLLPYLPQNVPVYGLDAHGNNPGEQPLDSVADMAALYARIVRDVQPAGPYRLAAWSSGGTLAYETARQLGAAGQSVALLAVFDSHGPRAQAGAMPDAFDAVAALMGWLPLEGVPDDTAAEFETAAATGDLETLLRCCKRHGMLPQDAETGEVTRNLAVRDAVWRAVNRYTLPALAAAEPVALTMVQFAASEGRAGTDDASLGWAAVPGLDVEVVAVPGSHMSMMKQPHVATLGDALARRLAGAGGEKAGSGKSI